MNSSLFWNCNYLIAYVAGPGDVIKTYRHWIKNEPDPHEVSVTYSEQFYNVVKNRSLRAYVVSSNNRKELWQDGQIIFENKPKNIHGKTGITYHLKELTYSLGLILTIIRLKAKIAVISDMQHWWLFAILRIVNIEVIPDLHCTFWPKGHRPLNFKYRLLQVLNSWFWKNVPAATICISPECKRQILELTKFRQKGVLILAHPNYKPGNLDTIPIADWNSRPFRLLFAGRIERNKGIFDLLELVKCIESKIPGGLVVEVCGSGSDEKKFLSEILYNHLTKIVLFSGKLNREEMRKSFSKAHAVIVPTSSSFAEGFNKVVVEGVLSGRPVIATDVCPATDVFKKSVVRLPAGDIIAMKEAVLLLSTDLYFYENKQRHCREEGEPFYDKDKSWEAALNTALQHTLGKS